MNIIFESSHRFFFKQPVSTKEAMLDITQIDNELCLLNNKK